MKDTVFMLLTCICQDCAHWEIVKGANGNVHLLCKTCNHREDIIIIFVDSPEGSDKILWVGSDSE